MKSFSAFSSAAQFCSGGIHLLPVKDIPIKAIATGVHLSLLGYQRFTCSRASQCANHNKYFMYPSLVLKGKKESLTYFQLCPPVNTRSKRVEEAMKGEGEVYNDMNDQSENSALPPHTAVVLIVGTKPRLRCTPRHTGAT